MAVAQVCIAEVERVVTCAVVVADVLALDAEVQVAVQERALEKREAAVQERVSRLLHQNRRRRRHEHCY